MASADHLAVDHGHHAHHVVPQKTYYRVFGVLVFLTVLTVFTATQIDLGNTGNILIALIIATIKATFVIAIFMGLKYDSRVNSLVFGIGLFILMIFIGQTLLDTEFRGLFNEVSDIPVQSQERRVEELRARQAEVNRMLSGEPVLLESIVDSTQVDYAPGAAGGNEAEGVTPDAPAPLDAPQEQH